jgi:predicted aspartyl protease
MSMFRVNVVAVNPKDDRKVTPPVDVLVDTGSELSWLPADLLLGAGIKEMRKRTFQTATKQTVTRPVGYAILRSEGFETIDEVVMAEPGDMNLLGVRTIEGFGVMVDNVAHRFVATNTIVAARQMHEDYVSQKIEAGLKASDEGRGLDMEEVRKRFGLEP